jgi:hypothetical protein
MDRGGLYSQLYQRQLELTAETHLAPGDEARLGGRDPD